MTLELFFSLLALLVAAVSLFRKPKVVKIADATDLNYFRNALTKINNEIEGLRKNDVAQSQVVNKLEKAVVRLGGVVDVIEDRVDLHLKEGGHWKFNENQKGVLVVVDKKVKPVMYDQMLKIASNPK